MAGYTDEELRTLYRDSKDKKEQLFILSQLSAKPLSYVAKVVADVPVRDDGKKREYRGRTYTDYQSYMNAVISDLVVFERKKKEITLNWSLEKKQYRVDFGNNLRKILEKRNVQMVALARSIGVCEELVSKWCRGIQSPDLVYVRLIHEELGIPIEELMIF